MRSVSRTVPWPQPVGGVRRFSAALHPTPIDPPEWRPFQLAFLLMNLRGIAEPTHADREVVDLLFFPTGGGKTEAYLGLAAFTLVLRRLRHPGIGSGGRQCAHALHPSVVDPRSALPRSGARVCVGAGARSGPRKARRMAVRDRTCGSGWQPRPTVWGARATMTPPPRVPRQSPSRTTIGSQPRSRWRSAPGVAPSSARTPSTSILTPTPPKTCGSVA